MNQLEVKFWKYIKDHLPGDVIRVENAADPGTPDVNGCIEGHEYWIELKVCTNKIKIVDPKSTLKDSQIIWHLNRGLQKGSILLLIRYPMQKMILLYDFKVYTAPNITEYKLIKQFSMPLNKKLFRETILQNA
jgi:hypothetical protein